MTGRDWLDEFALRVCEQLNDVEVTRVDAATLVLARGPRGLAAHDAGEAIWLSPSLTQGGVFARPADRVQHLEIQQYGLTEPTINVAFEAALTHLRDS